MQNLNARQKFASLFALTVFGIIVCFCIVFISIFTFTQYSQLKKDLYSELNNITENHLAINNSELTFVKDTTGESLRQHLANTQISVAFFDAKFKIARSYGIFVSNKNLQENTKSINELLNNTKLSKKTESKILDISDNRYLLITSTINTPNSELLGYIVLASSLSPLYSSFTNLIFISMGLASFSLLVSFAVGLLLMRTAFSTIKNITDNISKIDLNKLKHHKIETKGHPTDEVFSLAQKFNEMVDRLHTATQKQKEFVSNASHELKTPLTRMITSIETIEEENIRKNPDIVNIRKQLFTMAEIIDELLLLAKLREHEAPVGSSDLSRVIINALDENRILITEKNLHVNNNISSGYILPIPDAYTKIIITNLLTNAIKFSPNNSEIVIAGNNLKKSFTISNQSEAMSQDEKDKLFDRFFRSKRSQGRSGTGIGLAIVKALCDMYMIDIEVAYQKIAENESRQITTFTLHWTAA